MALNKQILEDAALHCLRMRSRKEVALVALEVLHLVCFWARLCKQPVAFDTWAASWYTSVQYLGKHVTIHILEKKKAYLEEESRTK